MTMVARWLYGPVLRRALAAAGTAQPAARRSLARWVGRRSMGRGPAAGASVTPLRSRRRRPTAARGRPHEARPPVGTQLTALRSRPTSPGSRPSSSHTLPGDQTVQLSYPPRGADRPTLIPSPGSTPSISHTLPGDQTVPAVPAVTDRGRAAHRTCRRACRAAPSLCGRWWSDQLAGAPGGGHRRRSWPPGFVWIDTDRPPPPPPRRATW